MKKYKITFYDYSHNHLSLTSSSASNLHNTKGGLGESSRPQTVPAPADTEWDDPHATGKPVGGEIFGDGWVGRKISVHVRESRVVAKRDVAVI